MPTFHLLVLPYPYSLPPMVHGVRDALGIGVAGGSTTLRLSKGNVTRWRDMILANVPDVLIITSTPKEVADDWDWLPCPVVGVSESDAAGRIPYVVSDDFMVGEVAGRHLLERGYRRFGFVGPNAVWSVKRWEGFRSVVERAGFECVAPPLVRRGRLPDWPRYLAGGWLEPWIGGLEKPIGLFAAHDEMGGRLIEAADAMRLALPSDVGVVAVDNHEVFCLAAPVPMSSVDLNMRGVGRALGRLAMAALEGKVAPGTEVKVAPAGVVARESSQTVACDDPELASTVERMHRGLSSGLNINEILKDAAISRSTLDRRFESQFGLRSGAYLRRARLERARRLLQETDATLGEIARECGMKDATYLVRRFRMAYGMTPGAFRLRKG